MGYFSINKNKEVPKFNYKSEAFDYMFAQLVEKGEDMMEAAEKAAKFAEIISSNKNLPNTPPKEMNGIEKGVYYIKQIAALKQDNPEVWELTTGIISGVIGRFTGGKGNVGNLEIQEPQIQNIDFSTLE